MQTKQGSPKYVIKLGLPGQLLVGKLECREASEGKLSWDQSLPENMSSVWMVWEDKLPSRITAPRSVVEYQKLIHLVQLRAVGDTSLCKLCSSRSGS